ncbi:MAG: GntR family transcriptional regulator [Hyphomicrobiaceae bacterium]|nr:MAG: GntR family transcriptional regulator [Hyphomicrobiaceae bacterium]
MKRGAAQALKVAEAPSRLRERAYESFREQLLAKRLRPGQFVSQRELVQLTGLTLAAIREMIPRLEADGLILTVPQRGLQIVPVDAKLIRSAFQLRRMIEREAMIQFLSRAHKKEIEAQHAELEAVLSRVAAGDTSPRILDAAQRVDWGFHDRLVESLDNPIVTQIYRVNSLKIRLIRLEQSLILADNALSALGEHRAILEAMRAGDVAAAVATLDAHIRSSLLRALGVSRAG